MSDAKELKSNQFDRLLALATLIATLCVSVAGVYVTYRIANIKNIVSRNNNVASVDVEYVKSALSVLRQPPDKAHQGLRAWAVSIVNKLSPVPLTKDASRELINGPLVAIKLVAPVLKFDYEFPSLFTDNKALLTIDNPNKMVVSLDSVEIIGRNNKNICGNLLGDALSLIPSGKNQMLILLDPIRVAKCAGYNVAASSGYRLIAINSSANQAQNNISGNNTTQIVGFILQSVATIDGAKSKTAQAMFLHFRKQ